MISIRPYAAADAAAVHALHSAAFPGPGETQLVTALHAGGYAPISLVAVQDGALVGHVVFSRLHMMIDGRFVAALALAPVAVQPALQKQGIGSALIRAGHQKARDENWEALVVLGEPAYYRRFGYDASVLAHIASPYAGEYLMGLELVPGVLAGDEGEMSYAPPFQELG